MEYNLTCPHCDKEISIEVSVESPSDYYFDPECPECSKRIREFKHWRSGKTLDLDMEIMNEVSEYYAGRAEFARDCAQDR